MPKLYAISDLHISYKFNHDAISLLQPHPEDTLILAGDIGERLEHLHYTFKLTTSLFKHVIWVPGNHELYTLPSRNTTTSPTTDKGQANLSPTFDRQPTPEPDDLRGTFKYTECVNVANEYGVITPDDEYVTFDDGEGNKAVICPLFTLYDYSFRPAHVSREEALDWAMEEGIKATDEMLLHPDPYQTRDAWCDELITKAEGRLESMLRGKEDDVGVVLVNHWPLREDLVYIPAVPRFSLWCGSKRTENWHMRFQADVVVTGHLHVRRTDWMDGVRFEEVSLGYPKQWEAARERGKGVNDMLRQILPGPTKMQGKTTQYLMHG